MALNVWNQPSGYSFGIFQERTTLNIPLPVSSLTGVTFTIISGKLPPGLRIVKDKIIGSPDEVSHDTTFTFCIRARTITDISDRTYNMIVQGEDAPVMLTPAGFLPVGDNNQYFVIDNSVVDYQLIAIDSDTVTGTKLSYFITSKDGALPPGLTLTTDGRISGKVQSVTEIRLDDGYGTYDTGLYGTSPYDYAFFKYTTSYQNYIKNGGYDYYPYDVIYDYEPTPPQIRSLNRNYEFIVTVSDGVQLYDRRKFQIYVVGDSFFRADTTALISNTGMFTADVSYLRNPAWITPSDLGIRRANNYITLMLDVYDTGQIYYKFETTTTTWKPSHHYNVNDLIYINSSLSYICTTSHTSGFEFTLTNWLKYRFPPGMRFDERTGEIFGYVPYQSVPSEIYKFKITAYRYGDTISDVASSTRTFTVNIISEINTVLTWQSDENLGVIAAGYKSTLEVHASSTIVNASVIYNVKSGMLPPGLVLSLTGDITGIVNQYTSLLAIDSNDVTFDYNRTTFKQSNLQDGLMSFDFNITLETTFDDLLTTFTNTTFNKHKIIDVGTLSFDYNSNTATKTTFNGNGYVSFNDVIINIADVETSFDNDLTTIDHAFTFNVMATDQYIYSAIQRTFTINVSTPNQLLYSNVYVKPLLSLSQRDYWSSFINNPGIFTLNNLYRPADSNFGVQSSLEMLIYPGIETKSASEFARATTTNFKKKQFHFNGIHKAVSMPLGSSTPDYEVVYVSMIDPNELSTKHLPSQINYNNNTYYPSSVATWREHIKSLGKTKGNFLPPWMRTIQPGTRSEVGFVLAIPLCYCKVGKADDIILNIKYSNFEFNLINYTIDRIILDSVTGYNDDKYIIFNNNREPI